jgi:hypothetical protein
MNFCLGRVRADLFWTKLVASVELAFAKRQKYKLAWMSQVIFEEKRLPTTNRQS